MPRGNKQKLLYIAKLFFERSDEANGLTGEDALEIAEGPRLEGIGFLAEPLPPFPVDDFQHRVAELGFQGGDLHAIAFLLVRRDHFERNDFGRFVHNRRVRSNDVAFHAFEPVMMLVPEVPVGDDLHGGIGHHLSGGGRCPKDESGRKKTKTSHS